MLRTARWAAAAALLFALPASAQAYWPSFGFGNGTPWGYGYTYNYGVGYVSPPPYYAVFPPVYYSPHITARHYGASPFAWQAGMQPITYAARPAPPAPPQPLMVENPYVTGGAAPRPAGAQAVKPLRIDNPFVVRSGG